MRFIIATSPLNNRSIAVYNLNGSERIAESEKSEERERRKRGKKGPLMAALNSQSRYSCKLTELAKTSILRVCEHSAHVSHVSRSPVIDCTSKYVEHPSRLARWRASISATLTITLFVVCIHNGSRILRTCDDIAKM